MVDDLTFRVVGIVSAPHRREAIGFLAVDRVRTVLVASPSAIGRITRGELSSVPAWPAFCAWKPAHLADGLRRVHPDGLVEDDPAIDGLPFLRRAKFISPSRRVAPCALSRRRSMRVAPQNSGPRGRRSPARISGVTGAGDFTTDEFWLRLSAAITARRRGRRAASHRRWPA